MYGDYTPASDIALTLLTDRLAVEGIISTRVQRLTDIFSGPGDGHLILHDAMFMEIQSGRVLTRSGQAQIQLREILLAHARETGGSGANRIPKQPVPATLLVPPYTVQGNVHLPFESSLKSALDALTDCFIPITSARYWLEGEADAPIETDLLIVNRTRAHIAIAAGVEWSGEVGPREADGVQNPW